MTTTPVHILIGSGKFGLGFAGELADRCGWQTHVIQRTPLTPESQSRTRSLETRRRYRIRYNDGTTRVVDNLTIYTSDFSNTGHHALECFEVPDLAMISVAVPETAIRDVARLIAAGMYRRFRALGPTSCAVPFLTCVNRNRNGEVLFERTREWAEEWPHRDAVEWFRASRGHFPDCVVDRACSDLRCENDEVQVDAESYCRLILPPQLPAGFERLLKGCEGLIVESGDVRAWEDAKYWGVNGLHLFLASVAFSRGGEPSEDWEQTALAEILADTQYRTLATLYLREVEQALLLRHQHVDRAALRRYLSELLTRIEQGSDRAGRILRDLRFDDMHTRDECAAAIDRIYSETADAGSAARVEMVDQLLDQFLQRAVLGFLSKVRRRVLEPAKIISDEGGLVPLGLLYALASVVNATASRIPDDIK